MGKRQGNRPDRRVVSIGSLSTQEIEGLIVRMRYVGSAVHKLSPGDYGFIPSCSPRPSKSSCDEIRTILKGEATELFRQGIAAGMVSKIDDGGVPKYVWAVDEHGEVYEAKTKPERAERGADYHGYRVGDDERDMRRYILDEWGRRCPKN